MWGTMKVETKDDVIVDALQKNYQIPIKPLQENLGLNTSYIRETTLDRDFKT